MLLRAGPDQPDPVSGVWCCGCRGGLRCPLSAGHSGDDGQGPRLGGNECEWRDGPSSSNGYTSLHACTNRLLHSIAHVGDVVSVDIGQVLGDTFYTLE
jgi:hypothetical protein